MALIDITPREAERLFDRLDSWYERQPMPANERNDAGPDTDDDAPAG